MHPGIVYLAGRAVIRPVLRLRYRPLITGAEHIPRKGPVLLVSNHLSALDTILIPSFASRQVRFLAKDELFNNRVKSWVMRQIGAVPVIRQPGAQAQAALETGRRILAAGNVFAIFPEGTRSTDGRLHAGQAGAAWLALQTGATIVPIGLIATDTKARRDRGEPSRRVEMRVGTPFSLTDLQDLPAGRARREGTERIMREIQHLSEQTRAD